MNPVGGHCVYKSFQIRYGWQYQLPEEDLQVRLPRTLHIRSSDKLVELVERGGGIPNRESLMMLNQAIDAGRGGVFLNLTAEQYREPRTS